MDSAETPVVFIHGLWLHASSWTSWLELFSAHGYAPVAPGWPCEAPTVEESRDNAEALADHGIDEVTEHYARVLDQLPRPAILIGHSFGGMIAEKLLGSGHVGAGYSAPPRGKPPASNGRLRFPDAARLTGGPGR